MTKTIKTEFAGYVLTDRILRFKMVEHDHKEDSLYLSIRYFIDNDDDQGRAIFTIKTLKYDLSKNKEKVDKLLQEILFKMLPSSKLTIIDPLELFKNL